MRWWIVRTLLGKELLEVVRDRRSLFLMIVLPLVMYPVIFLLTAEMTAGQMAKIEAETARVLVTGQPTFDALRERIQEDHHIELVAPGPDEVPMEALGAGTAHAVLELPANFDAVLAGEGTASLVLHYDETREVSVRTRKQLREILAEWKVALVDSRLRSLGHGPELARPLEVEARNVAPPQKVGGYLLAQIVPMLIVLMIVLGAFYPAIEVTAGEKERGTLQTLLTAPITPLEIVTGKFLSVFAVALVTGAANIASIGLMFGMTQLLPAEAMSNIDLGLSWATVGLMGLLAVLIGLMFSAIMMTVAVLAKTFKEAQSYMTPVYLVCVLPVLFAQLPGVTLEGMLVYVPCVNQTLLLKEILSGTHDLQHFFIVVVTSLVYTGGVLIIAARIFEHEAILLGEAGISALLSPGDRPRIHETVPRLGQALALTAIVFLLLFYVGSVVQAWNVVLGLAITQWLLIGGAVGFFVWRWKLDFRATLGLRAAGARPLAAAALFGLASWYPLMLFANWVQRNAAPLPEAQREVLERLNEALTTSAPLPVLLLVIAVSPALCEEALFRGVLLRSMAGRYRQRTIVLVTALLFGAFHMSVMRFAPTAALGVVAALLALRSGSLLPGVLFHAIHNGLVLLLGRYEPHVAGITVEGTPALLHLGAVALALGLGTWLLLTSRPRVPQVYP